MATERIENPFGTRHAPRANGRAERAPASTLPLRGMTGYEEEAVERHLESPNTAALCNEVVARCLVAPGADHAEALARVRALPVVERDLALLALRRLSFGDRVTSEVTCPSCRARSTVDFQLSALPPPPAAAPAEVRCTLEDGVEAVMRCPTAGDQEALLDADLETESARRTFLLARVLVRHGAQSGPFSPEAVHALPVSARRAMESALESALPDFDLGMAVTCAECGAAYNAPFDVAAFFLPS